MSQEWQQYIERLEKTGLNETLVDWIDKIYRPDLQRFARLEPEKLYADLNARSERPELITLEQAKRILEVAREDSPSEGVTTVMSPTVPNQPSVTAESARISLPAAQRQPVPLEDIGRQAGLPDGETKATTAKSPQKTKHRMGASGWKEASWLRQFGAPSQPWMLPESAIHPISDDSAVSQMSCAD